MKRVVSIFGAVAMVSVALTGTVYADIISATGEGKQEIVKMAKYASLKRVGINYYTKGVRWNYYYNKHINEALNKQLKNGLLYVEGDLADKADSSSSSTP